MEAAGLATLEQVLTCFPRSLIASQPGRLPEEADEDAVVTLVARVRKAPVSRHLKWAKSSAAAVL
jgi:hypothetical protein